MKYAIEVNDLKKSYSGFDLMVDELLVPSGVIVGLIGENGAGKTTLLKLILNIIHKEEGTIKIFDKNLEENELEIKEDIGVVLDNAFFPEILHAKNINSIMSNVYKNWDSNLFYRYLKDFGIQDSQVLKTMSKGMRKKVEIAVALAHHPRLLILDEATSGLDPVVRDEILDLLLDFVCDDEHTVILSTHITSDLEHIADYIVFMNHGKVFLKEKRDDIFDKYGILKCDIGEFDDIDKRDIVSFRKHKYGYEILVNDRDRCMKKYKNFVIDKISLENLMLLIIKGGK